jgi:hypothetical protein
MAQQEYKRITEALQSPEPISDADAREYMIHMHDLIFVLCKEIEDLTELANVDTSTVH